MSNYLITGEKLKELGLNTKDFDRVFDYVTYRDMEIGLENLDYVVPSEEELCQLNKEVFKNFDNDTVGDLIGFLKYKNLLVKKELKDDKD